LHRGGRFAGAVLPGDAGEIESCEIQFDRIAIRKETGNAQADGNHVRDYTFFGSRFSLLYVIIVPMRDPDDPRARLRLILISIILGTLPCYCLGWVAVMIKPGPVTPAAIASTTAIFSLTPAFPSATLSLTPTIMTGTPSPTWTASATDYITPTSTFTPFMPPTYTFTPSLTPTYTPTATATLTPTYTPTFTLTPTFTTSPTSTPTPTATPTYTAFPTATATSVP